MPPAPTLGETLGAIEIGVLCSSILYGVMLVQIFNYYQLKFTDGLFIRLLVPCVLIVETTHLIFLYIYVYRATISHYGDILSALQDSWSIAFSVILGMIVTSLTQLFFTYRLRNLSKSLWLASIAWVGILGRMGTGVAISVQTYLIGNLAEALEKYRSLIITNIALGAAIDSYNTACLCVFLSKNRPHFKKTQRMVDKLIKWSIETGLITSISAILMVIIILTQEQFEAQPNTILFLFFVVNNARLYSNTLIASLNGRASIQSFSEVMSTGELVSTFQIGNSTTRNNGSHTIEVHVDIQNSGGTGSSKHTESNIDQQALELSDFQAFPDAK